MYLVTFHWTNVWWNVNHWNKKMNYDNWKCGTLDQTLQRQHSPHDGGLSSSEFVTYCSWTLTGCWGWTAVQVCRRRTDREVVFVCYWRKHTDVNTPPVLLLLLLLLSPVLLSFQQLPVGGDLNVQSQFQVHQVLQAKKEITLRSIKLFTTYIRQHTDILSSELMC